MKEVTETTNNLPANILNMATALAQSAAVAGSTGAGELYLKMTKFGEWVYGAEGTELQEGATLAVNPEGFQHGWVAWGSKERGNAGSNVGEVMVSALQPLPAGADLPDVNGDWSKAVAVQFKVLNGEDEGLQLLWKANSGGARKAYASFMQALVLRITAGETDVVAIVELVNDSYVHGTYGKIFTPEIKIHGWMGLNGTATAETPAIEEPAEEPAPEEAKPARRRRKKA